MATTLDALLKIKADVKGTQEINGLTGALIRADVAAKDTAASMGMLSGATGMAGLAGIFSKLTPLLSAAGLISITQAAIDAGNQMYLMSQRTGVSVEMLAKLKKAAAMSGADFGVVEGALIRLSRAMGAAASQSRFGEKTKEEIDKAVQAVKDGERDQLYAVRLATDLRIEKLKDESDKRLDELGKRYKRELQLLEDSWDDQDDAQTKAIRREYETRREAIQNNAGLNDMQRKLALQSLEDEQDEVLKRIRRANRDQRQTIKDQRAAQEAQERKQIERNLRQQEQQIKESADRSSEAIKAASDAAQKALKGENKSELADQLESLGVSGKGASEAFRKLGISIKSANGMMRDPGDVMLDIFDALNKIPDQATRTSLSFQLLGKQAAQLNPMMLMGSAAIRGFNVSMTAGFAKDAREYTRQLGALGGAVGALGMEIAKSGILVELTKLAKAVTDTVSAFTKIDPVIRKSGVSVFLAAFAPLTTINDNLKTLQINFDSVSLKLALLFSGPSGWTALLVNAGASLYAFKDQVVNFLIWWGNATFDALMAISKFFNDLFIKPFVDMFNLIKKPVLDFLSWFDQRWKDAAQAFNSYIISPIKNSWDAMIGYLKGGFNSFLQWLFSGLNKAITEYNKIIGVANTLPGVRQIDYIANVGAPQFANGGVVNAPTMAMVGEGGQREYIIPESKMASASARYLSGSRGGQVLGSGNATMAAPVINITTGPVIEQNGQQYVSVTDLERAMRATADGVMSRLRTPSARLALGMS